MTYVQKVQYIISKHSNSSQVAVVSLHCFLYLNNWKQKYSYFEKQKVNLSTFTYTVLVFFIQNYTMFHVSTLQILDNGKNIQNSFVHLWFCSSKVLNFNQENNYIIQSILYLLFKCSQNVIVSI